MIKNVSREHHRKWIKDSAIADSVAQTRGYRSLTEPSTKNIRNLMKLGFYQSQLRFPTLLIPIWGVTGDVVGYQLRHNKPRVDRQSGKQRKYENLPGMRSRLDVHPENLSRIRNIKRDIWITEGIRKADALTSEGAVTVGLFGVWNWRGMDEGGAISRLPDWDEIPRNRTFYIVFDSDVMTKRSVQKALERIGRWLQMGGADVNYVYLDDMREDDKSIKMGVDDFLASGGSVTELRDLATDEVRGLPTVIIAGHQLREASQDVLDTLVQSNDPPQVFIWGDKLARVKMRDQVGAAIEPFDNNSIRSHMSLVADYIKPGLKGGFISIWPPKDLSAEVLARPEWKGLPSLRGITESPTMREDGTIIDVPGYDKPTQLMYVPSVDLEPYRFPERPTKSQRTQAINLLYEQVQDFPFDSDAHRANWLAFLLTPIIRPAIRGAVPLAILDAPQQSSGKTLLAKCCGIVATGREPELRAIPKEEEEWRKTLASALRSGPVMTVFDNLNWKLRSSSLTRYLTAGGSSVADRSLGMTEDVVIPVLTTWALTGNNVDLDRDLVRRSYRIRLNANIPHPEWRNPDQFNIPDLIGWTLENRSKLIAALLVLSRAWYADGKPKGDNPILANFESWCEIIGGILQFADIDDFLKNTVTMYEMMDAESSDWASFLAAWDKILGTGKGHLSHRIYEELAINPDFREKLPIDLADAFEKGSASFNRAIGWKLRDRVDHVYNLNGTNYALRMKRDKEMRQRWGIVIVKG